MLCLLRSPAAAAALRVGALVVAVAGWTGPVAANTPEVPAGMTFRPIDPEVLATIRAVLPEQRAVDAAFLDPRFEPTVRLSETATVELTFIDEGAGYRNSLGWFSVDPDSLAGTTRGSLDTSGSRGVSLSEFQAGAPGLQMGWVFPNASALYSGGQLRPGNTVKLGDGRRFNANTAVGFFLVQNGWDAQAPQRSSPSAPTSGNALVFYTLDYLNPEAPRTMTSTTSSEGTRSRHVAMLFASQTRDSVILGFEDLHRTDSRQNASGYASDEDFNDAVFLIRSDPVRAISGSRIATAPGPLAGSGLGGLLVAGYLLLRHRARRWRHLVSAAALILLAGQANAEEGCLSSFLGGDLERAAIVCPGPAEEGDAAAIFVTGALGPPDAAAAERAYREAAAKGFAPAQTVLGILLTRQAANEQRQCRQRLAEAARWLAAAAEQGYAPAQVQHGLALLEGRGMPADPAAAAARFRAAAEQGSADALFLLAGLHRRGLGVPPDEDVALRLFVAAADRGHPAAAHNLAVILARRGYDAEAAAWAARSPFTASAAPETSSIPCD